MAVYRQPYAIDRLSGGNMDMNMGYVKGAGQKTDSQGLDKRHDVDYLFLLPK